MNRPAAFPDEDAIDFGDLTRSVGFLLRMAQLQSFDMFFARLAKHGLKPGEFTLLWVVGLNPGLRQGSLARRLRIKPAHMTKLVQRLVAADLLARTVPDDDRRSVRLSLTGAGTAFVARHRAAFLAFHDAERHPLTDAEHRQLLHLLGKLTGLDGETR